MPSRTIVVPANARSRRTRGALLAAARSILEEHGFEALTMTAVAERATVTRGAAYLHFPSRTELVAALFDYVADAEGLHESLREVWAAPDAASTLDRWAAHLATYHPRLLAVDRALQQVWRRDPDAAAHRARVVHAQLANCRRITRRLVDDGHLAPGWTIRSATDMLYALISSDIVEGLLVDRHWSTARLARHLALLLRSTFLTAADTSDPPTSP
ncbi:TetR/AcrR family transcriptional regulator [Actinoplanes sp. NPDC051513]|uniref:TetR/AcrR family transcriptional regulator n=1 Tax=Actinoplanes sp. NPDC051513 TaxID=3363908 RepID=UPI0037A0EA27